MKENKKSLYFKLVIVFLSILLMGSFWLTMRPTSDPVSMVITPEVPREGEPVLTTFRLNNPLPVALPIHYQFYANGELLADGTTTIAPVLTLQRLLLSLNNTRHYFSESIVSIQTVFLPRQA